MTRVAADKLPGVLGHELRNPLAAAMTGTMVLREMVDQDDPRAGLLEGVLAELQRAVDLTDGWLAAARGQSCRGGAFALATVVHSVATRHDADLVSCSDDVTVTGNAAMIERALDNLCDNARRAGAKRIRIALQRLGDELAIHVEDDGAGVPADQVERIFTPGWSSRGGAGLGLHAVAATMSAHGGHVRCVPLARGTRFSIVLPCVSLVARA